MIQLELNWPCAEISLRCNGFMLNCPYADLIFLWTRLTLNCACVGFSLCWTEFVLNCSHVEWPYLKLFMHLSDSAGIEMISCWITFFCWYDLELNSPCPELNFYWHCDEMNLCSIFLTVKWFSTELSLRIFGIFLNCSYAERTLIWTFLDLK